MINNIIYSTPEGKAKYDLIEKLLANTILPEELAVLREEADADDLSYIIQKIYDLNETYILKLAAVEDLLVKFNRIKNEQRNAKFFKKIRSGFRDLNNKSRMIVLAEGDSWFNYPVILTDTIDRISQKNWGKLCMPL